MNNDKDLEIQDQLTEYILNQTPDMVDKSQGSEYRDTTITDEEMEQLEENGENIEIDLEDGDDEPNENVDVSEQVIPETGETVEVFTAKIMPVKRRKVKFIAQEKPEEIDETSAYEKSILAFSKAQTNYMLIKGYITEATPVDIEISRNQSYRDYRYKFVPLDEEYGGVTCYIGSNEMTDAIEIPTEFTTESISRLERQKRNFARSIMGSPVDVLVTDILYPQQTGRRRAKIKPGDVKIAVSRTYANEALIYKNYLSPEAKTVPESNHVAKVVAVYSNRLLLNINGFDVFVNRYTPYIFGAAYVDINQRNYKKFYKNGDKIPVCVTQITKEKDEDNEDMVTGIGLDFRRAIVDELQALCRDTHEGDICYGTIVRVTRSKETNKFYAVVRLAKGLECVCDVPSGSVELLFDRNINVNVTIYAVNANTCRVAGNIKR